MAARTITVWLKQEGENLIMLSSDPPGKTKGNRAEATHVVTIPIHQEDVSIDGDVAVRLPQNEDPMRTQRHSE